MKASLIFLMVAGLVVVSAKPIYEEEIEVMLKTALKSLMSDGDLELRGLPGSPDSRGHEARGVDEDLQELRSANGDLELRGPPGSPDSRGHEARGVDEDLQKLRSASERELEDILKSLRDVILGSPDSRNGR